MLIGSAFTKRLENKNCDNANHRGYQSVSAAMDACISDANCFGVQDYKCDGDGWARLCDANPKRIETDLYQCIHVRTGNNLKDSSYCLIVIGKCYQVAYSI